MADGIRDCLPPDRHPRRPGIALPKGSIDTHVHVFERRYPLSPGRGYNPPDSTLADLKHLHATLGVDRVVFTQPSVYGTDNAAILDGMGALNKEMPDRARCVVAIDMDSTAQTVRLPPVAGEAREMYRRAAAGEGLVLSDNFARRQQLGLGDTVEIAAPYGLI